MTSSLPSTHQTQTHRHTGRYPIKLILLGHSGKKGASISKSGRKGKDKGLSLENLGVIYFKYLQTYMFVHVYMHVHV